MKKEFIKVNNDLVIEIVSKKTLVSVFLYKNGIKKTLSEIETNDYFCGDVLFDKNYIVVYAKGCSISENPLNVKTVYDIKEEKILDLSNEIFKILVEYMFISKKGFKVSTVINFLNNNLNEEVVCFINYLTANNKNITKHEIINYVINNYPQLKKYINVDSNKYKQIKNFKVFFNIMPQHLDFIEKKVYNDTVEQKKLKQSFRK